MNPVIGILDIGLGNIASISNAVYQQGVDVKHLKNTDAMDDCTHLILPGVGHYEYGVDRLKQSGFFEAIPQYITSKRPLLGVCLGMQLLFEKSEEDQTATGLELLPGEFKKFNREVRVPHMGWNMVSWENHHPVLEGVKPGKDYYFVHSYFLNASQDALGITEYGEEFISSVAKENVLGFQFHPEKSQKNGLSLIENFCWWDGQC